MKTGEMTYLFKIQLLNFCLIEFYCGVCSSLSTSALYFVIPGCEDKLGNNDLISVENTDSLTECALSCETSCVCFGFHRGRKLCRKQTQCKSSRMDQIEIGWMYFTPNRGWTCNSDTGRCYSLNSTKLSQAEAMQSCYRRNSYLVEINDLEENTWITTNILNAASCSNRYLCATWTGGSDRATEGAYIWEHSNTTIGFTHWSRFNPDNNNFPELEMDCIDIFYNGEWNDRPCSYLNAFLCERENK